MKTVWTNGCFDILHRGHIEMLAYAKSLGKHLVVGIDSDKKVKLDKGISRPYNTEEDRKTMLTSLKYVDEVVIFDTPQELEKYVKRFRPTCMVVGADWKGKEIVGSRFAKTVKYFERIGEYSTTQILERNKIMAKKQKPVQQTLTEAQVRELADQMLRAAFREHSRDMETHVRDIDQRLKVLEGRR